MLRNVMAMAAAFAVGALLMIGLRGSGTGHAGMQTAEASTEHQHEHGEAGTAPSDHAHHAAGHADEAAAPAVAAPAAPAPAAPAPAAPAQVAQAGVSPAEAAKTDSVNLWVCAQDDRYALSWAGNCPLDGKPMVPGVVDASTLKDLNNEKCPIMGGKTKKDVYAVYAGTQVHFCCKGCDGKFFASPDEHIKALTTK